MRRAFLAFFALAGAVVAAEKHETFVCSESKWRQIEDHDSATAPGFSSGDTLPQRCTSGEVFFRRIQAAFRGADANIVTVNVALHAVVYTMQEKCRECVSRYAVGCIPEVPDCGVPWKTVTKIEQFLSLDAAMKFVNRKNVATWFSTGTLTEPEPVQNLPANATLVGVFRMSEIGLTEKTKTTERPPIPQEPLVETVYEVKK